MNKDRKVIITSDSTCDLSKELVAEYGVHIISLHVTLDGKNYRDGVDISIDDIYSVYKEKKLLPKTAAVSIGEYSDIFRKYLDEGFEVVHFSLSSKLSSSYVDAKMAAEEFDGVEVVDTKRLSTGSGLLIIKGCELADQGLSAKEISEKVAPMADKISTSFILDTLEFMHKGGRCSTVAALGANFLKLKPSIEMPDGALVVGKKYRGNLKSVLQQYVQNRLEGRDDLDLERIFITHTNMDDPEIVPMVQNEIKKYANFKRIHETIASCTVVSHCGPNTLGILFMTK